MDSRFHKCEGGLYPYSDIFLLITGLNSINGKSSPADWKVRQYHKCIFFPLFFFPQSVCNGSIFIISLAMQEEIRS